MVGVAAWGHRLNLSIAQAHMLQCTGEHWAAVKLLTQALAVCEALPAESGQGTRLHCLFLRGVLQPLCCRVLTCKAPQRWQRYPRMKYLICCGAVCMHLPSLAAGSRPGTQWRSPSHPPPGLDYHLRCCHTPDCAAFSHIRQHAFKTVHSHGRLPPSAWVICKRRWRSTGLLYDSEAGQDCKACCSAYMRCHHQEPILPIHAAHPVALPPGLSHAGTRRRALGCLLEAVRDCHGCCMASTAGLDSGARDVISPGF